MIWVAGSPSWNLNVRAGPSGSSSSSLSPQAPWLLFQRPVGESISRNAAGSLYPLVTVLLVVVFLNEHLDLIKIAPIAIALIAGMALSKEGDQLSVAPGHDTLVLEGKLNSPSSGR